MPCIDLPAIHLPLVRLHKVYGSKHLPQHWLFQDGTIDSNHSPWSVPAIFFVTCLIPSEWRNIWDFCGRWKLHSVFPTNKASKFLKHAPQKLIPDHEWGCFLHVSWVVLRHKIQLCLTTSVHNQDLYVKHHSTLGNLSPGLVDTGLVLILNFSSVLENWLHKLLSTHISCLSSKVPSLAWRSWRNFQ